MSSSPGSATVGSAWQGWGRAGLGWGVKDSCPISPGIFCGPGFGSSVLSTERPVALPLLALLGAGPDLGCLVCPLFLSWGVPLVITVAAVALKKIGYDASDVSVGWCWIDLEAEDRVLWMLLTGKLWEMLAYVSLPVLYFLIRKHINRAVGTCAAPSPDPRPQLRVAPVPLQPGAGLSHSGTTHGPSGLRMMRPWREWVLLLLHCGQGNRGWQRLRGSPDSPSP